MEGHLVFEVGGTRFALDVSDVTEVLRATEVRTMPVSGRSLAGRGLGLVDARGRSVPVLDLRSDLTRPGDVVVPVRRDLAGLVVDHVVSVLRAGVLLPESDFPPALPSYARGVLRPAGGGDSLLWVAFPEVPEPGDPAYDARAEPALGEPVLEQSQLAESPQTEQDLAIVS
jgi:chemotaxis signal transduction protein